jgi:tetratricopeptide (TPR) repeat protein
LLLVLATPALRAAAPRVYARVDADTAIYPGDDIVYSVVVEGGARPGKIDVSSLAAYNPRPGGTQTLMQTINDRTMLSHETKYVITAGSPGTMQLPGVTVVVDGQTQTTNAVEVTVSRPGSTDQIVLELSVTPARCYVGQPLVMTAKWTATARVREASFEVPVFQSDDFYIEDLTERPVGQSLRQILIHSIPVTMTEDRQLVRGMEALVGTFRKVVIPKRSGRLRLDPFQVSANVAVRREPTGDFFNPYRLVLQRVQVQSNAVELEVQPLPETGKPPEFYGLVGRYTITAAAAPTQVSVGDPITLTIRIGGNPYLKPVQWPALEQVPELAAQFRIPAEKASPSFEAGTKVFTQTLRANSDQVTQIPALPLAYFDPEQGKYVVARTQPIPLEVAPTKVLTNQDMQGTVSSAGGARDSSRVQAIRQGLSANYYGPEVLENQAFSVLSLVRRPVHAVLWALPLTGLLASVAVKWAGRTSPESRARQRRRRAAGTALTHLQRVSAAAPGQRHELLLSALKTYIGDRFGRVAASLTAQDCGQAIVDATGDAATARKYQGLIDACEAAHYASAGEDIGPDQVQTALDLIQAVEKAVPRRPADAARASSATRVGQAGPTSYLLLLALCLALGPVTKAVASSLPRDQLYGVLQEAGSVFQQANAAADPDAAGPLYDKAILLYEKLIDQGGLRNAKLYYNLANAYLLRGLGDAGRGGPQEASDLGRAILNYRRAARLDRSDVNIQKNLAFARSQRVDQVQVSAERRVLQTLLFWHYDFALPTKSLLAALLLGALCVALTLIVWRGRGVAPSVTAAVAGVLFVSFSLSILVETRQQARTRWGVITVAQVVARQGDGPNYPPSFQDPLHAGTEFELLERRGRWLHLRLSDGSDAWICDDAAGLV